MLVDKDKAAKILSEEHANVSAGAAVSQEWVGWVRELAAACEGASRTPIAALGTAILSKATNLGIDPFSLKVSSGPRGYSARAIAQHVLAAHAPRLALDLGVTGREPLNNQPFFGKIKISSDLPVKGNARASFEVLLRALSALNKIKSHNSARAALRAFIKERRRDGVIKRVGANAGDGLLVTHLIELIEMVVEADSEGGKRAQAIVAGLMDVIVGRERVMVSRINDPDRRFPCDVAIRSGEDSELVTRTYEVRDKAVTDSDLYHAVEKSQRAGVTRVGVVAVADTKLAVDIPAVTSWATDRGVLLRTYLGWEELVREALFLADSGGWSPGQVYRAIDQRLQDLEVSSAGLMMWRSGASSGHGRKSR